MVAINENFAGGALLSKSVTEPVAVDLPAHLPVDRIFLHQLFQGDECWVFISDGNGSLIGLLASRHSEKLSGLLKRTKFAGPATRCAYTENLFAVGYAIITYSAAQWLTREVRTVLNMRPHVRDLLAPNHAIKSVWGGKVS